MKIRNGFVSNSSSSSFIVCGDSTEGLFIPSYEGKTLSVGLEGEREFGWFPKNYYDFPSKLNFACIQAIYCQSMPAVGDAYLDMLKKVLQDYTNCQEVEVLLVTDKFNNKYDGYIDHQSAAYEGGNTEMFESEDHLANFLFHPNSRVHTDNDNY